MIHDWLAMVALDDAIDRGAEGAGDVFASPTLMSMVDWTNPQAYDSPGAPPNGGDFVKRQLLRARAHRNMHWACRRGTGHPALPRAAQLTV